MPLRLVIQNTSSKEIDAPRPHPSAKFVEAALHTAKNSKKDTRNAIIADISDVLNCRQDDLNFMFEHNMVPHDRRPVFELELPDYRMKLSDIYKEAAE